MAIDYETIKRLIGNFQDKRRAVFTLSNGDEITPIHIHRVNNCSLEVEEPGSVTVIPLDQIATVRFIEFADIELDD